MVTRQLRLSTRENIRIRLPELIGKKINIVLSDRTVLFGELHAINDAQLTFLNMRLDPVRLALTDVVEVYVDFTE